MLAFFKVVCYIPLYNGLIFLIGIIPGASVAVAVVLFTAFIKLLLFPLSYKAAKFQFEMKAHEAELNHIKEQFKNDKQAQGKAVLDFYRAKGVNPFAGLLPVLIQIPLIISLYYVFFEGGLPAIDPTLLYSWVPVPKPDMFFWGVDIGTKSLLLAVLAGVTQFFQARLAMPPTPPQSSDAPSLSQDMARGMQFQMKYVLPIFMGFVSYQVSAAVALYFVTSNLFAIGQEIFMRRKFRKQAHSTHS